MNFQIFLLTRQVQVKIKSAEVEMVHLSFNEFFWLKQQAYEKYPCLCQYDHLPVFNFGEVTLVPAAFGLSQFMQIPAHVFCTKAAVETGLFEERQAPTDVQKGRKAISLPISERRPSKGIPMRREHTELSAYGCNVCGPEAMPN